MTLAIGWLHDGGETVGTWLHEAGDWQPRECDGKQHRRPCLRRSFNGAVA